MLKVKEFYKDKTILITGCTGFIGKVILEKLLRTCGDCKKIYVLIRAKRGLSVSSRLEKEIYSTYLFQHLFYNKPETKQISIEKVVPVAGDLTKEGLGLEPTVRAALINELDVIVSNGASVDIAADLRDLLVTDYFGPVMVLELAKQCRKLVNFHHVSTASVNSN